MIHIYVYVYVCVYIYIYVYVYCYVYIVIYIYREREIGKRESTEALGREPEGRRTHLVVLNNMIQYDMI